MNATETVRVTLNGERREVPADLTVDGLLRHLDLQPRLVVVELNGDILRREGYTGTPVGEDDALELVHFVGGG
jgi:thiamine biosynthesis protein ThiS